MQLRIALTGGIAEGKSTVLGYIQQLGVATALSDELAREVFERPPVQSLLSELLDLPTPLQRADVREKLSISPKLRREVNALLHKEIWPLVLSSHACVVEVPLLIEACLQNYFSRIWVVTCGPQEQLRRLTERLGSEQSAKQFLTVQLPTRAKIPFSDRIFRTDRAEDAVYSDIQVALMQEGLI